MNAEKFRDIFSRFQNLNLLFLIADLRNHARRVGRRRFVVPACPRSQLRRDTDTVHAVLLRQRRQDHRQVQYRLQTIAGQQVCRMVG